MTRQDGGTEFPTWAILAPCSRPSRTLRAAVGDGPRPFLTATVRNALHHCRRGRRNGLRPNKETVDPETVNSGTALPSDRSALVSWHIFRWAESRAMPRHFVARISSWAKSALRIDIYLRRTYSGRPSFSIRLSDATAMATSVVCRPSVRERSASPITRL